MKITNKGYKELKDINYVIDKLNIKEDDFVIKLTGRYYVQDDSAFITSLNNINLIYYDVVLRYGGYTIKEIIKEKSYSCHTSFIGTKANVIKKIEYPEEGICVEWKWAEAINLLPYEKIFILDKYLGVKCYVGEDIYTTEI